MKQVHFSNRREWREWLTQNHEREEEGIWLVFCREGSGKPSLRYEDSVEEALCFGWIDSIIKHLDEVRYCRKFTPRKDASRWSLANRTRAERLIRQGRMTKFGLKK